MYLLDINVLIALLDQVHVFHERAIRWFVSREPLAWATCPITQNGVLRILSGPRYRNSPGNPAAVATYLAELQSLPGHAFWPDDITLIGNPNVTSEQLQASLQITDSYLLALAVAHDGKFVTFDRRIDTSIVRGGAQALLVLSK